MSSPESENDLVPLILPRYVHLMPTSHQQWSFSVSHHAPISQKIMQERAHVVLLIFPRNNLGHQFDAFLELVTKNWVCQAYNTNSGCNQDGECGVSMTSQSSRPVLAK